MVPRSDAVKSIDQAFDVRGNNFNLIRFGLAAIVLIHHAIVLTVGEIEPVDLPSRVVASFGTVGVDGFFIISGFLVTRSIDRRPDWRSFIVARTLRIFPGLWAMLIVTLICGAALGSLAVDDFVSDDLSWQYLLNNATGVRTRYLLPGLFGDNRLPAVNGSLWSLRWELYAYTALLIAALAGALRYRWSFLLAVSVVAAAFLVIDRPSELLATARRLTFAFHVGSILHIYARQVRMHWQAVFLAMLLAFVTRDWLAGPIFYTVALASVLNWLALVPRGILLRYNGLPDVSYGLYIYAFPIQQFLIAYEIGDTPTTNVVFGFPLTLLFATASWFLIERPALRLKDRLVSRDQSTR